ncbi:MAG: beta-CASP ribonuclease aCPSF1 [Candidatus Nanohaloarchaeota archaeon]|nr:beta-CASP ribonuclease aCPSF1 [Candidatus Nanohaloarchaeota archaeon]
MDNEEMSLEKVKELIPKEAKPFKLTFEGPDIVIYTKNKKFFLEGAPQLKELTRMLRKRIHVRPDPSILLEPDKAKKIALELIPEEAEVKEILFEPEFSKMIIFAKKPGIAIGKDGEISRALREKTNWYVEVLRVPLIPSAVVNKAREIIHEERAYRKKFLEKIGEKIQLKKGGKSVGWIRVSALGAFREVGRSALLLQTKSSRILLDFGAGMSNNTKFPHTDAPEFLLDSIDAIILSHAHMDHCGMIPLLYEYGYKGPLYLTEPTRDLMVLLQLDYIDVSHKTGESPPYTSKGIKQALRHSITLDYGEVFDITPDMRLTFQNAGHIIGSASVHLHIGEGYHNFVYTGDIKFGPTRLLEPAFTQYARVESMVIESTYGGKADVLPPLREAEENLMQVINETLEKKGKVLIPVFSVGRSQEVMVVLANYKQQNPDFNVPVYLDGMIWDATAIHTTYPEYLSRALQRQILHYGYNPFADEMFKEVKNPTDRKKVIDEGEPSIILATAGMMNGGPVLEYFKHLAENEKNTLVFIGYQAQGTLGSKIQKGIKEVSLTDREGKTHAINIKMRVETVEGFSGHSDRRQLLAYLGNLTAKPKKLIINHGEAKKSLEFAAAAHKLYKMETVVPWNLESVRLK